MAKVTLYSARACPFAHRTRLVLSYKKVDFELVEVDLEKKPPWFETVSGYGKVPAIAHGGAKIWESAIINEYLDEVFASPALLPRQPAARAAARIWIDWANTRFVPAFAVLLRATTTAEQVAGRRQLAEGLGHLEREGFGKAPSPGPFFLGAEASLVDFTLYPWFERWPALEHYRAFAVPEGYSLLARWRRQMADLEAVRAHENPTGYYIERYARYAAPHSEARA
jgi:glutathione S-transferase